MKKNERWKTKEEAKAYIRLCGETHNYGLSFFSACAFVGVDPSLKKEGAGWALGLFDDWVSFLPTNELREEIATLEYEVFNGLYAEENNSKLGLEDLAMAEECLKIAKTELRERRKKRPWHRKRRRH